LKENVAPTGLGLFDIVSVTKISALWALRIKLLDDFEITYDDKYLFEFYG
jgi:hypothetical protein